MEESLYSVLNIYFRYFRAQKPLHSLPVMEHQDVPDLERWRPTIQRLLERYISCKLSLLNLNLNLNVCMSVCLSLKMFILFIYLLFYCPEWSIILTDTFISVFGTGGKVTFNVGNDSPTLTGARVTFTIDLQFPHKQKVLPDGDVVWAEDCVINGNACTFDPQWLNAFI